MEAATVVMLLCCRLINRLPPAQKTGGPESALDLIGILWYFIAVKRQKLICFPFVGYRKKPFPQQTVRQWN